MPDEPDLIGTGTAARLVHRSRWAIHDWVRRGRLVPHVTAPGHKMAWRFVRGDVLKVAAEIDSHRTNKPGRKPGGHNHDPETMEDVDAIIEDVLKEPLPSWWLRDGRYQNREALPALVLHMLARRRCRL
jgi:hypothetical protein